ncbi:hypothetical protein NDU88_002415 [Pleurodeles waltl]|uniref:Uncharacterized protein n=1 Tax=Pleurodeles waltl TaxID=8319 RepID=A0AAV7SDM2_PLEWA|nr:hypothetical protein NDU88_002415 [Pleurodeles waltl]
MATGDSAMITATDTDHTHEPAEECPVSTFWNAEHPEVFPNPDIRVEDARTQQEAEPERGERVELESGEGAELEEKERVASEEGGGNSAQQRSLD